MWKKILGVIIITSCAQMPAFSCRYKILDLESENYTNKIWIGQKIPKEKILTSLNFLDNIEEVNKQYSDKEKFNNFCKKITENYENEKLTEFTHTCKNIYEESNEEKYKVSIYMLLEKVTDKFTKINKKFNKKKKLDSLKKEGSDKNLENLLNIFSHADKSIILNK